MYNIYKPTKKNTGAALGFQASDKDGRLYVTIIKQHSWDDQRQKGSFNENRSRPGFNTTLKFNVTEAGTMIDAVENNYSSKFFHNSPKGTTQIEFGPAEGEAPVCFIFRVVQTDSIDRTKKNSFFIPITFGEVRTLKEYLVHYIHKAFRFKPARKNAPQEQDQPPQEAEGQTQPESEQAPEGQENAAPVNSDKW